MRLHGMITALVTPFAEGALDEEGLRTLIRRQVAAEVDGVVLLGTTGEASSLTEAERLRVIEIGVEELNGHIPLLIGTGSNSTQGAIALTRQAQQLGADGALVVAPYYVKPTQTGLYAHFHTLANSVDLPLMLYNHPGRCGCDMSVETILKLMEIDTILGIKECAPLQKFEALVHARALHGRDFWVLSGDDPMTLATMAVGGDGCISVASNLVPKRMRQLVQALAGEHLELARRLHRELRALWELCDRESNPMAIKALLSEAELPSGGCRLPLSSCSEETLTLIQDYTARSSS